MKNSYQLSVISYKGIIFCLLFTAHCFAQDVIKESLSDLNRILPAKKIMNESWGRDPFAPLTGDRLMQPAHLELTAIIYNDKKPSAVVNHKIVFIGDAVDGQKVIDITKHYVILRGISGTYKLEIGSKAGKGYEIKKTE
ncbi:MAG: hypothetical protein HY266_07675 [Deltaproteobacteria bacterium]|nr:hypothetical protein [Deltaproteobacteria bacterium]